MINFDLMNSAFRGYAQSFRADLNYFDVDILHRDARSVIFNLLNSTLTLRLRLLICLSVIFTKQIDGEILRQSFYFCSNVERILSRHQLYPAIDRSFEKIINSIETFVRNGSGWNIETIKFIDLSIGNYRPLRGGCRNVILPFNLKKRHALLNINCEDNKCFIYSILSKLYPVSKNANRCSSYKKFLNRLQFSFLKFPVTIDQISSFESRNNLQIFVFGYEHKEIYPIYSSKRSGRKIELLLYKNHYFCIRNFNKLLHEGKNLHWYCSNCLIGFQKKHTLLSHQDICLNNCAQKIKMPSSFNNILKFQNGEKQLKHSFVCYADFESVLVPVQNAHPDPSKSFTNYIEVHKPISYALIILGMEDEIVYSTYYSGEDVVSNFLALLKRLSRKLIAVMRDIAPMLIEHPQPLDDSVCSICKQPFAIGDTRVRNHSHSFGEISGIAHSLCNLMYQVKPFLPVVIHNLKGYDSHLILKELGPNFAQSIRIIPVNTQKFTTFSIDDVKFLDSFQFLNASLATLVQNLIDSNHEFPIFNTFYAKEKNRNLLKRKQVFPYSFLSDISVLDEIHLPSKDRFFNKLTNTDISTEDYNHALLVYRKFKCKTFFDYLKLYQILDVVLLAEVFSSYRQMCMKYYSLDPVYFITASDLSWSACLLLTKVELRLFTDVTMYVWLEAHIRGGLCLLNKRHSIANNPYIPETFNENREHCYILALDVTNLYGKALSEYHATGHFKWLTEDEIRNFDVFAYDKTSDTGYFLEVDIHYPQKLHKHHDDFPLAPQHIVITYDMLSDYQKALLKKYNLTYTNHAKKLTPNFYDKHNYVVHYRMLQFYIAQGLIIKKIHRILCFRQERWIEPYIAFNTEKRKKAQSLAEKNLFKLMVNSYYGRCLMNPRNRVNVEGVFNVSQCQKKLSSPLLQYFETINENFAIFKMKKRSVLLRNCIYTGFTVLELAKLRMYQLYYSKFKEKYNEKCRLLYSDTDSLYLEIKAENVFHDLKYSLGNIMDLSNYPRDHFLYDNQNEGKLGVLKSETSVPIKEFVGLKCKAYAMFFGENYKKTAKGVKKSTLQSIDGEVYKTVLYDQVRMRHQQTSIISDHHNLKTVVQNRVSLSPFFDKKFQLDNGIDSLTYGSCMIDEL